MKIKATNFVPKKHSEIPTSKDVSQFSKNKLS